MRIDTSNLSNEIIVDYAYIISEIKDSIKKNFKGDLQLKEVGDFHHYFISKSFDKGNTFILSVAICKKHGKHIIEAYGDSRTDVTLGDVMVIPFDKEERLIKINEISQRVIKILNK